MAGKSKKLKLAAIHEIIPEEIFVMILKKLDFKSMALARGTCTEWRNVIDGFELLSLKNFCKCLLNPLSFNHLYNLQSICISFQLRLHVS